MDNSERADFMTGQPIPNFFIAGAPKAGTTSLYHYLRQHPDIFMSPVKEPFFFSHEFRPANFIPELRSHVQNGMTAVKARLDSGLDANNTQGAVGCKADYLKLFSGATGERAIGEATVCYLWSRTAPREIAAFNSSAKILLVLRHPTERAFSQYIQYLADGHVAHTFSEQIAASLRSDGALGPFHPFLDFGFYSQQIERVFDHFPQRQVRVWLYEDTLAAPAKFLREVLTFLEVDPSFVPDTSRRYLEVPVPKAIGVTQALRRRGIWRALRNCTPAAARPVLKKLVYRKRGSLKMSAEDRRFLIEYYREDVRRLEHVIERDLSAWQR